MKFKFLLAASALSLIVSCSKDDDSNGGGGTYKMTELIAPEPVDLNGDGKKSSNLVEEVACLKESRITLKDNKKVSFSFIFPTENDKGTLLNSCEEGFVIEDAGDWSINGDKLFVKYVDNETKETLNEELGVIQGNKLIVDDYFEVEIDASIDVNGNVISEAKTISYDAVFTK